MKCELAFDKYKYLTLESPSQLDHHIKEKKAFRVFLDVIHNTDGYIITVGKLSQPINGSILVWGRCTEQGRARVIAQYGFADILSLEAIIHDLLAWQNQDYIDLVGRYETWSAELFAGLRALGSESQMNQHS
jgi:hypothetical protein